jgi:hypothetical protein
VGKKDKQSNNSYDFCNEERSLASCLYSLSPKQLSLLSSLIGILLIDNLDVNQQNSLGNFIVGVGQILLISAAQEQLLESQSSSQTDDINQQIQMLKDQIYALEKEVHKKN